MARSFQAVVIGGGPGGYVAAIRLAQQGLSCAVIERESMGGVCLNWGCIPSKALIHVAHTVHHLGEAESFGVKVGSVSVDIDTTRAWKDKIVTKLTGGVAKLVSAAGATIINGEAKFLGPSKLSVKDLSTGVEEEIQFEKCLIATGARPIEIPGFAFDGELVWSAREATNLPRIPKELVVIGGGIIGLELGTVYAKLGSKVTVVEMLEGLLPGTDPELTKYLQRRLKSLGVTVLTGTGAKALEQKKGQAEVLVSGPKGEQRLSADAVLVAVGFRPNTATLGLESIGLVPGRGGAIEVDASMATSVPGIFAIGDVTGAPFLAHRAFKQGEVAAEAMAGKASVWDSAALPTVIYTDPEIASTGLTEASAKEQGLEVKVGKFHFAANGRALGMAESQGFVKVVVDASSELILGVQVVGPGASEMVGEATLGIEMAAVVDDLGLTIHAHPSLSEALQEATLAAVGRAVHTVS